MTPQAVREQTQTGLLGPVAFFAGLALVTASPLVRGGNRYSVLILLELVALACLFALLAGWRLPLARSLTAKGVLLLASAPIAVAICQLVPLWPADVWLRLPGREAYAAVLDAMGMAKDGWRALSVAPDATAASLLAGIPLAAALLLGFSCSLAQLRTLLAVVAAGAVLQVTLGLVQMGGGGVLMFGAQSEAPVGTFGNRNHFASYVGIALCLWIWLAWGAHRRSAAQLDWLRLGPQGNNALKVAIAAVLVIGLLASRSRGAIASVVPAVLAATALTRLSRNQGAWDPRWLAATAIAAVAPLAWLLGADSLSTRFTAQDLAAASDFRAELARSTLAGASAFWPFGSGWGTYAMVYPRFQPGAVAGYANHAHLDYAEFLLEGGILFVAFSLLFVWLAIRRSRALFRALGHAAHASSDAVAAAFCGIALCAMLLHSFVDFGMRIPANAILACLLAGAFLRPLHGARPGRGPYPPESSFGP